MIQIFYLILSIVTLGFLVFVHELGHYYVARKMGMRVEAFSIGFGRAIYRWTRDNVQWQVCWIPFGGYVKIAGMEEEEIAGQEIEGSFFSKTPFQRMKVALSGPTTNLLFALIMFSLVWTLGGREKPFSEYTHYIGWVDPDSELYFKGVRAGDAIISYNGHPFKDASDHITTAILSQKTIDVKVEKQEATNFLDSTTPHIASLQVQGKSHPASLNPDFMTTGVLCSAQYLIYDCFPNKRENPINKASPMYGSGLQYGDRVVWAGGEIVFSAEQLSHIINAQQILMTIRRNDENILLQVPCMPIGEYNLQSSQRAELTDWQYESSIKCRIEKLLFIPYQLNENGTVMESYNFFDSDIHKKISLNKEKTLQSGDRIVAVDGQMVVSAKDILQQLQKKRALIIVQRNQNIDQAPTKLWTKADLAFVQTFPHQDIQAIVQTIGTEQSIKQSGDVVLLSVIEPNTLKDLPFSQEEIKNREKEIELQKLQIGKIDDLNTRQHMNQLLELQEKKRMLLVTFQDQKVIYNPLPWISMKESVVNTWRTLNALIQGFMSPKWLAGPVGIVNLMQTQFQLGLKEALFWMATISMQLGLLNLLPIPVFDGGHIAFAVWEMITGRRPKGKIFELIVSACAIVLIFFAIYITYHDLTR